MVHGNVSPISFGERERAWYSERAFRRVRRKQLIGPLGRCIVTCSESSLSRRLRERLLSEQAEAVLW